uniref:Armadillo repeat-containing domain-containing protein n=1 Tax=Amphimedon queenslandica TaxID=400682 RepID=A0A1X7T9Q7_AMPQE
MVLPDSCRGIAPQAAPCILLGMDSPPKSYTILRHTAAILGNIAFEKELYRREIKVTGGVTLLLELLDCPDDKVKEASLGAVINLTHSKEVCVLMRQLGAIQIITELCTLPNISIQISGLCLGILTNALINDTEEALEVFEVYHVYDRLMKWQEEKKEHCADIEGIIEQVLTTISGLRR